jgi:hypothetical protein
MSSFVAPEVAKPADGQKPNAGLTPAAGQAHDCARLGFSGRTSNDHIICLQQLHHPAYHAQAPPVDPAPID